MNTSKPDEIKVSAAKSDAFGGIPEGWDIKTVKDIGRVVTGKTPPTKEGKYFGRDYPFIKIPDMGESVRIENSAMMLSHEGAQYMRSLKLPPNSVMVSCLATIGKVGITVKDSFTNQQINSIIPDSNKVVPEWIYYYFKNNTVYLESLGGGGSVYTNISKGRFENAEIVLPSIAEQRAIAKILSDLDAKIELNHQMNKTLEQIAQAIFKRWFVDFKFPGYEKAKFIDDLPEGWRLGTLGEIADNPRRGINPAKIVMSTPYIGLEHMPRRCISLSEWGYADNLESNKFAFKRGEILFGKLRPYFHKVGIAPIDGVCSTDILVVASNEPEWFGLVLAQAMSDDFINYATATSTGTKMPRTNWQDMARYEIAVPTKKIAVDFTAEVQSLIDKIIANIYESRILSNVRDTLLSRLMSGELAV